MNGQMKFLENKAEEKRLRGNNEWLIQWQTVSEILNDQMQVVHWKRYQN